MKCPKCQKENDELQTICMYCGEPMTESFMLCPKCSKVIRKDEEECPRCKTKIYKKIEDEDLPIGKTLMYVMKAPFSMALLILDLVTVLASTINYFMNGNINIMSFLAVLFGFVLTLSSLLIGLALRRSNNSEILEERLRRIKYCVIIGLLSSLYIGLFTFGSMDSIFNNNIFNKIALVALFVDMVSSLILVPLFFIKSGVRTR